MIGEAQVGPLPEVVLPIKLFPGDTQILTRASDPGADAVRDEEDNVIEPAYIHCTLAEAFEHVRPGESVWFDDGKIGGIVQANDGERIQVEITQTGPNGGRLRAEKGINFPDTNLEIPALTEKDQVDLRHVVEYVDMVALSFYVRPRTWSCWSIISISWVPATRGLYSRLKTARLSRICHGFCWRLYARRP